MGCISYERFGANFVRHAVTPERIAAAMADVAGDTVDVGPMPAGPGGIAVAKANGRIGAIQVTPDPGEVLRFAVILPIELELEVKLGAVPNRYTGQVTVPLSLTVRASEPLKLNIAIDEVTGQDVRVELEAANVTGGMLQRIGNLDTEVQIQVARVVNERINSERSMETREIDVAALIDESWKS